MGAPLESLRSHTTLPMGFGGDRPVISEEQLEPGDRLLFFTDGVIEDRTSEGVELGVDGLIRYVNQLHRSPVSVAETVRLLSVDLTSRRVGAPADDSTLVLVEWNPQIGRY